MVSEHLAGKKDFALKKKLWDKIAQYCVVFKASSEVIIVLHYFISFASWFFVGSV